MLRWNTVSISLGNRNISQVRPTNILVIQIDDKLNYNDHIPILSKKLSGTIGTMRRIPPSLVPPSILKTIYFSFFYSRLFYGITVGGGGMWGNKYEYDEKITWQIIIVVCELCTA